MRAASIKLYKVNWTIFRQAKRFANIVRLQQSDEVIRCYLVNITEVVKGYRMDLS